MPKKFLNQLIDVSPIHCTEPASWVQTVHDLLSLCSKLHFSDGSFVLKNHRKTKKMLNSIQKGDNVTSDADVAAFLSASSPPLTVRKPLKKRTTETGSYADENEQRRKRQRKEREKKRKQPATIDVDAAVETDVSDDDAVETDAVETDVAEDDAVETDAGETFCGEECREAIEQIVQSSIWNEN